MTFFLDLQQIAVELMLACGACVFLLLGVFRPKIRVRSLGWATCFLLLAAAFLVIARFDDPFIVFDGNYMRDGFTAFVKALTFFLAALTVVMSFHYFKQEKNESYEYFVLILLACVGAGVMLSSQSIVALYLGIELQSLPLYALAAFQTRSLRSNEAGLKYFILAALSSGLLLYGCSLLYGFGGAVDYATLGRLSGEGGNIGLIVGWVFLLSGLIFKISVVPFHMWTPDVYEGTPTPVTAFLATVSKLVAMAVIIRLVAEVLGDATVIWQKIFIAVSVASMVLGALAAIQQQNLKRLIAYSSIGHMGYALLGLIAGSGRGFESVIVYMVLYTLISIGIFSCILAMRRNGRALENIEDLAGLSQTSPVMAFFMSALLLSLAGIPPLAGFFAKFYVFLSALEAGFTVLVIIAVLTSAVAAFYYLRLIKIIYFDPPHAPFDAAPKELRLLLYASGAVALLFFLVPSVLLDKSRLVAQILGAS